ncbi:MAG: surface protein containing Ig-like domain-like [Ignavibacteria bacterium]|nr:surface protein containing Ig-like domain-like [Ignavibacteria bacterium]
MKIIVYTIIVVLFASNSYAINLKGSGTKVDPYQIYTIKDFQSLQYYYSDKYFILMNDIDASETRNWNVGDHDGNLKTPDVPMGFDPISFSGLINGDGHIIRNLYINNPFDGASGLFKVLIDSEIKKLGLENCEITSGDRAATFCAMNYNSYISECYTTGTLTCKITDGASPGGFCSLNGGVMINCFSTCDINLIVNTNSKEHEVTGFSTCILGSNNDCVKNSYITGKLNINKIDLDKLSRISAFNHRGQYVYWDVETTGIPDSTIFKWGYLKQKGYCTADMKLSKSYYGFDFQNIWCIDEGKDYPKLRAFKKCSDTTPPISVTQDDLATRIQTMDITPSPANSKAQIRYSAPYSNIIKITITNIYGEEVAVPVSSQNHEAGQFSSELDVSAFPSGVYFCVLQTPAGAVSKQFVVVH